MDALANATLDGMEKLVKEKYHADYLAKVKVLSPKVHLVRYADDFVVTAAKRETLEEIQILLTEFLSDRGLMLSEEKTLITHISKGFDFLGFSVRKYNDKLLIKPSKKSQKKMAEKLHQVVFSNKSVAQNALISQLNPIITGWGNYFKHVVSKKVFSRTDHILFGLLKRWAFRRHTNKSQRWILNKYFHSDGKKKWCFKEVIEKSGKCYIFVLKKLSDIPISRHVKIKKDANPFDWAWAVYFEKRRFERLRVRSLKQRCIGSTH